VLRVDSAQKSRGGRLADTPAICCLIFHSVTTGTLGGSGWLPMSPRQWKATPAPNWQRWMWGVSPVRAWAMSRNAT